MVGNSQETPPTKVTDVGSSWKIPQSNRATWREGRREVVAELIVMGYDYGIFRWKDMTGGIFGYDEVSQGEVEKIHLWLDKLTLIWWSSKRKPVWLRMHCRLEMMSSNLEVPRWSFQYMETITASRLAMDIQWHSCADDGRITHQTNQPDASYCFCHLTQRVIFQQDLWTIVFCDRLL